MWLLPGYVNHLTDWYENQFETKSEAPVSFVTSKHHETMPV